MALTCSGIILAARDAHPSFDRHRHPDGILLRHLSTEHRRLAGKVLLANRAALVVDLEPIALSGYDFDAGSALPAHQFIQDVSAWDATGCAVPVRQIAWENRLRPTCRGFTWSLHDGKLFLSDTALDWADVVEVRVSYAPITATLATLAAVIALPDSAEAALQATLCDFMARRSPADLVPPADRAGFRQERESAEIDFLATVRQGYKAKVIRPQGRR
jgi:hypothetical protein